MFKIRYFAVADEKIQYYETYTKEKLLGDIDIASISAIERAGDEKYEFKFKIATAVRFASNI